MTLGELSAVLAEIGDREGGERFMGRPDRWYESPTWRCVNDHVSTFYLDSTAGAGVCLADGCREPLLLTFPEDVDGPLVEPT